MTVTAHVEALNSMCNAKTFVLCVNNFCDAYVWCSTWQKSQLNVGLLLSKEVVADDHCVGPAGADYTPNE